MMRECWINVYYYPSTKMSYQSHYINSYSKAVVFGERQLHKRKLLYRIHVRLK